MTRAYYNEIDPYAAQWLRNLVAASHIAPGDVDERSIEDVKPDDLKGYTQCHFFAGVGVWSYALRLAGWADDRPVWTGSCPCQPFSAAGKGGGFADERHLWPAFFHLIQSCRPNVIFGEQVASKDGLAWLDLVHADLETSDYAAGAIDLCAAGVGAPHIRQRLFWVADAMRGRAGNDARKGMGAETTADREDWSLSRERLRLGVEGASGGLAAADDARLERRSIDECRRSPERAAGPRSMVEQEPAASPTNGFWRDADWLYCRDGKWRPVEPSTFPLVNGAASRVGRLRAYGNAIVPQVAAAVIGAYMDIRV